MADTAVSDEATATGTKGINADEIFTGEPEHEKFCRDLVTKSAEFTIWDHTRRIAAKNPGYFPGPARRTKLWRILRRPGTRVCDFEFAECRGHGPPGQDRGERSGRVSTIQSARKGSFNARFWDPTTVAMPAAAMGGIDGRERKYRRRSLEHSAWHKRRARGQGNPQYRIVRARRPHHDGRRVGFHRRDDRARFRAFETKTGKHMWETKLDSRVTRIR